MVVSTVIYSVALIVGCGISGTTTGFILLKAKAFSTRKSIAWMATSWALSGVIFLAITFTSWGFLSTANLGSLYPLLADTSSVIGLGIGTGLGGLITWVLLLKENSLSSMASALWVTGGWALGGIIGSASVLGLMFGVWGGGSRAPDIYSVVFIVSTIAATLIGAIGGFFTVWQIRTEQKKRALAQGR
ncbi:MAG: hypothetical protein WA821_24100 [Anaerolineales bacterium]